LPPEKPGFSKLQMPYFKPIKRIFTESDLEQWKHCETYSYIVDTIETLASSVEGKELGSPTSITPSAQTLLDILETVSEIVDKYPVVQDKGSSRFGKVEFRDFYDDIEANSEKLLAPLATNNEQSLIELTTYFNNSWGDRIRIDYGSGHELNFLAFLLCLLKLKVLTLNDSQTIVLKIFSKYLQVMRKIQKLYWLEPAGSHGVWGLDDYHFLPFLFGAAQLSPMTRSRPSSIHNKDIVDMYKDKYFYYQCIDFINQVKTGPGSGSLRWHSPMLDDISGVRKWSKVSEGMQKMYKAEVLCKLPIIQHFYFGSILKAPENLSDPSESADNEHGHQHTWGDCCGIAIPSPFAAKEMQQHTKTIPFD